LIVGAKNLPSLPFTDIISITFYGQDKVKAFAKTVGFFLPHTCLPEVEAHRKHRNRRIEKSFLKTVGWCFYHKETKGFSKG